MWISSTRVLDRIPGLPGVLSTFSINPWWQVLSPRDDTQMTSDHEGVYRGHSPYSPWVLLVVLLTAGALLTVNAASGVPADLPDGPPGKADTITAETVSTGTDGSESDAAVARTHRRPVPGAVIQAADIPEQNWLPGHRGVDLAARPGDPVHASASGTVRFAGSVAGTPVVSVDHGNGLITTYEPVETTLSAGDGVTRGQSVGTLADAARLPDTARRDPGLSWGARLRDNYIDPMTLLGGVTVRLWS